MELRHLLRLARRWWWALLLGLLALSLPAYLRASSAAPTYQARTLVFVNVLSSPGAITYSDALLSQQLVQSYSEMVVQPIVLAEVRQRLHLPQDVAQLSTMVRARPQRETQLFEVSARGENPQQVAEIANMTIQVFIQQQAAYLPPEQSMGAIRVAQPALVPTGPIAPHPARDAILAGLIGVLLAGAAVYVYEYLDDTIRSAEELEATFDLPALGSIARHKTRSTRDVFPVSAFWQARHAESLRLIRTNLAFAGIERPLRTVLVTSAGAGEGKSSTSASLAAVLAQAEKRVVLLDADLRSPVLHRYFNLPNDVGLSTMLLADSETWDTFIQSTSIDGLRVLSSGPIPPNPVELLSTDRFGCVLAWLVTIADIVVIDSPPVLAVADAAVLASRVDGTVLVVDSGRTRTRSLQESLNVLRKSGTRLIGAVVNGVNPRSDPYSYSNYNQPLDQRFDMSGSD